MKKTWCPESESSSSEEDGQTSTEESSGAEDDVEMEVSLYSSDGEITDFDEEYETE